MTKKQIESNYGSSVSPKKLSFLSPDKSYKKNDRLSPSKGGLSKFSITIKSPSAIKNINVMKSLSPSKKDKKPLVELSHNLILPVIAAKRASSIQSDSMRNKTFYESNGKYKRKTNHYS